jgi:hypothetical protein
MRKYLTIYEEAVSHKRLCHCSILNFLICEENFLFFFISVVEMSSFYVSSYAASVGSVSCKFRIVWCLVRYSPVYTPQFFALTYCIYS